jgi:hypothetical protein
MIGSTFFDDKDAPAMTGTEEFPILGRYLPVGDIKKLIQSCKGLNPYWHCLQKAMLVRMALGYGDVMLGSLYVWNEKMDANYGYEFNLPLEFHAWWQPSANDLLRVVKIRSMKDIPIIDLALPGVISRGTITIDDQGPILTGRTPAILNGSAPLWCDYVPMQLYQL